MAQSTATRLKILMAQRDLKQADILRLAQPYCEKYKVKIGKSDMSQFVSGKVKPGQWKLTILGLALNVSEAWLMGLDVPMEREKEPIPEFEDGLDKELIDRLCQLTPAEIQRVDDFVKGILAAR